MLKIIDSIFGHLNLILLILLSVHSIMEVGFLVTILAVIFGIAFFVLYKIAKRRARRRAK